MVKRAATADGDSGSASNKKKKVDGAVEREDKLLAFTMQSLIHGDEAVSFRKCSTDMGFMERTTTMRNAWKALLDKELIEPCNEGEGVYTSDHKLTQKGKDHASTDEYKEHLKDLNFVATTNEEHQARIKKKLINKHGVRIFDLLLEHGSLTRKELAAIIGMCDRSHPFNYALQQLKQKLKHVEDDPSGETKGKLRLADKAFLRGKRPESEQTDPEKILKLISLCKEAKLEKKESTKSAKKPKRKKNTATEETEADGDKKSSPEAGKTEPESEDNVILD